MKKSVISKDDFSAVLDQCRYACDFLVAMNGALMKYECGSLIFPDCCGALIQVLEWMFDDTENELISYFCFELDFGRSYTDGVVQDEDGTDIKLDTYESLYEFLIKEMDKNG